MFLSLDFGQFLTTETKGPTFSVASQPGALCRRHSTQAVSPVAFLWHRILFKPPEHACCPQLPPPGSLALRGRRAFPYFPRALGRKPPRSPSSASASRAAVPFPPAGERSLDPGLLFNVGSCWPCSQSSPFLAAARARVSVGQKVNWMIQ